VDYSSDGASGSVRLVGAAEEAAEELNMFPEGPGLKPLVIWPLIQRPEGLCSLRVRASRECSVLKKEMLKNRLRRREIPSAGKATFDIAPLAASIRLRSGQALKPRPSKQEFPRGIRSNRCRGVEA
jgi:hypothetical protein